MSELEVLADHRVAGMIPAGATTITRAWRR
jgi:hypothetical protein